MQFMRKVSYHMNKKFYDGDAFRDLLSPRAYEDGIFLGADDSLSFGFEAVPLAGADDAMFDRFKSLLNMGYPDGTIISFTLLGTADAQKKLAEIKAAREGATPAPGGENALRIASAAVEERIEHLRKLAVRTGREAPARDFRLVISVKRQFPGLCSSGDAADAKIEEMKSLRTAVTQTMDSAGLCHRSLTAAGWLRISDSILNPFSQTVPAEPDQFLPLGAQLARPDAALFVKPSGLLISSEEEGEKSAHDKTSGKNESSDDTAVPNVHIATLSPKTLCRESFFGNALYYAGDAFSGSRGLNGPFFMTASVWYPPQDQARARLSARRQWTTNQAYGPIVKFVPELGQEKQEFDEFFQSLGSSNRVVRMSLALCVYGRTEEELSRAERNAETYLSELGFRMMRDRFFALPIFLNALPLGADAQAMRDLMRYRTMTTEQAATLLPIFAEWKGTGTPKMSFIGRSGQIMALDLFDSGTNFNLCIAAQSGAGKSFLVNEILVSYLSAGAEAWVIDVGRSYEKLCRALGGNFVEFSQSSGISLNPFSLVTDYREDADTLAAVIAAMASGSGDLSDLQTSALKRQIHAVWEQSGTSSTVDELADALLGSSDPRVRDLGDQLYPFTEKGEYGRYFSGPSGALEDAALTVLELEELKGRKHLQQVVLLELVFRIQKRMYLGDRSRPKLVIIDEAWDLLTSGEVGKFIETGYRRFRKYGGAAVTVTQSVNDLYSSPAGRAIAENSANMFLLGQKAETIEELRRSSRLPLSDAACELLRTVRTEPGRFSEIYFITDRGQGVGRLEVNDFQKILYSTKAEEVSAVNALVTSGMSLEEAIRTVAESLGKRRA